MSIAALGVFLLALTTGVGVSTNGDEGLAARIWQLLMVGQLPVIAYFGLRWLPVAPRDGALIVAAQIGLGLAVAAPIFVLHL